MSSPGLTREERVNFYLESFKGEWIDPDELKEEQIKIFENPLSTPEELEKVKIVAEAYKIYLNEQRVREVPAMPEGGRTSLDFRGYCGREVIKPGK